MMRAVARCPWPESSARVGERRQQSRAPGPPRNCRQAEPPSSRPQPPPGTLPGDSWNPVYWLSLRTKACKHALVTASGPPELPLLVSTEAHPDLHRVHGLGSLHCSWGACSWDYFGGARWVVERRRGLGESVLNTVPTKFFPGKSQDAKSPVRVRDVILDLALSLCLKQFNISVIVRVPGQRWSPG